MATAQVFTFNDLKDILVKRIRLPESQIKNDPALSFDAMGLDSLALVELQLEVQQRYGFTIPDADVREITTIGQAIDYTNRRLQKAGLLPWLSALIIPSGSARRWIWCGTSPMMWSPGPNCLPSIPKRRSSSAKEIPSCSGSLCTLMKTERSGVGFRNEPRTRLRIRSRRGG